MSTVSFSGLATGLNTDSIITQLVELKRAPVYRLQKDKKGYQDQISGLARPQDQAAGPADGRAQAGHRSRILRPPRPPAAVSESLTVSAGGTAAPGQYEIIVKTLATAQKLQSQGYDSKLDNVGTGSRLADGRRRDHRPEPGRGDHARGPGQR